MFSVYRQSAAEKLTLEEKYNELSSKYNKLCKEHKSLQENFKKQTGALHITWEYIRYIAECVNPNSDFTYFSASYIKRDIKEKIINDINKLKQQIKENEDKLKENEDKIITKFLLRQLTNIEKGV